MTNDMTISEPARTPDLIYQPPAMLSPERFQYLWRYAEIMASTSTVPESLRTYGAAGSKKDLPRETVVANCFLVCEQADRWGVSPFALLTTAAIVHGKLGFEGKTIHAVLQGVYGIHPDYTYDGDEGTDNRRITVTAITPNGKEKSISGTVKDWKTTGNGSPWRASTYDKMLGYRGVREWAREHYPAAIMGIVSDDELQAIAAEFAAQNATTVADRLKGKGGGGFSKEHVAGAIGNNGQVPMDKIEEAEVVEAKSDERETPSTEKVEAEKAEAGTIEAEKVEEKQAEQEREKDAVEENDGGGTASYKEEASQSANDEEMVYIKFFDRLKRSSSYEDWAAAKDEFSAHVMACADEIRARCRAAMRDQRERLKKEGKWNPPQKDEPL